MTQDSRMKDTQTSSSMGTGVRFNLKKRSVRDKSPSVNLSSYNSDFLDGLFADVAMISDSSEASPKRPFSNMSRDDCETVGGVPSKKSRTSLHTSMSRVFRSTRNLSLLGPLPNEADALCAASRSISQANDCLESSPLSVQQETLQFLPSFFTGNSDCMSGATCERLPTIRSTANLTFPNLPATVSDSSCNAGLTRVNLVRQASVLEKPSKESFGWFVDLDDNVSPEANSNLPYTVSSDRLAFQAPTAPKAVFDQEELEWAQAADTVDDVLGDFF